jgi:polyhydroxyalkanoate synthesis repressor PhaR
MPNKKIILKRYENRRIYNLQTKKYINLNDINEIIQKGEEVQVIDNKNGEDITNQILLQIIFNISLDKMSLLSTSFLHRIIAMQHHFYNKLFIDFLENSYRMFFNVSNFYKKKNK